jgi:hypothetical protein
LSKATYSNKTISAYDEIRLKFSSLFNPEPYEGLGFNFSFAEPLPAAKIQFLIGDIGYLFSSHRFLKTSYVKFS